MKFAVIGLGYFGSALVRELVHDGQEVIAIDSDVTNLRDIQDLSDLAAEADGTDIEALRQLGVDDVDTAIVAIGEDFESSLMITAHCQTLGVKKIYTRVINEVHDHILGLMQVTGKIRAEKLAATYFTRQLTNEAVMRYFGLDADHGIVELALPEKFDDSSIAEMEMRKKFKLNVVTIRRPNPKDYSFDRDDEGFSVLGTPEPETKLKSGDRLVVFGRLKDIDRFCAG